MNWFKKKPSFEEQEFKNITEKMDQAIRLLEKRSEYRNNAIRSRAIRQVKSRMDEITNYMIANMKTSTKIHSQVFNISDIFGIREFDTTLNIEENDAETIINALKGKDENIFSKFLCDNKLTMALDDKHKKVKFAYGPNSSFGFGWIRWAGYDLY